MSKTDLTFHAPDLDLENRKILANLSFGQKLRALNALKKSGLPEAFNPEPVMVRDIIVDVPAFRHPLGPKAVVALNRLNYRAKSKAFFTNLPDEKLLNLASFPLPREPGKSPEVAKPIADTEASRLARSLDETRKIIAQLEHAAVEARARLSKMEHELCAS